MLEAKYRKVDFQATLGTPVYSLWMVMSLQCLGLASAAQMGQMSKIFETLLATSPSQNLVSHVFWNQGAAEQPPWFPNWNGQSFQFQNCQILKMGQFGRHQFWNWSKPLTDCILYTLWQTICMNCHDIRKLWRS